MNCAFASGGLLQGARDRARLEVRERWRPLTGKEASKCPMFSLWGGAHSNSLFVAAADRIASLWTRSYLKRYGETVAL